VFDEQFTMLHPHQVNALSAGGNGVAPIPKLKLDNNIPTVGAPDRERLLWRVGVANLEDLVGKPFDQGAWLDIAQYRYIGSEDQWDPDEHDHSSE
jgi:hypothetical protein